MARADDGHDELSQLSAIVDMMRAKGVVKLTKGIDGLEILMGPPVTKASKAEDKDPRAGKRAHYMNLLGRPHSDEELDLLP